MITTIKLIFGPSLGEGLWK